MLISDKPATGWGRLVRIVLLMSAIVMFAAAVSTIEEGTGGFTSPRHRAIARAIILAAATIAAVTAIIAWHRSHRAR